MDQIPKCEVKLEVSDESDNELSEENMFLEELNDSDEGGSGVHDCYECGKTFSRIRNLTDHVRLVHTFEPCPCPFCEGKILKNQTDLTKHIKRFHEEMINKQEIKKTIEEIKTEELPNDVDNTTNGENNKVGYKCELCDCDSFELCDCDCK